MARIVVVDDAAFMRVRACKVLVDTATKPMQPNRVLAALAKILA